MRAGDLCSPFPSVRMDTPAIEAARLLAGQDLPGLVVVDARDKPVTVLPGTQVLRLAVPQYIQDDPALARVVDEAHADQFLAELADRTVRELLPEQPRELPVVDGNATVLEVAALMARSRSPLVAVVARNGVLDGVITLDALLDRMLGT
ncbi:CBS domain-containing protein [Tenggerimyces flavus]|uniref:CBS domain-containing protein n=1 Tax=Tenggerimyces flavus TaxID=1708749 RepID=A0ABV7YDM9_9ACTN|nr:CBS domain-containing protein [Tenggerimyces flavus]MBM7786947.1 CBS domain-containing protein [Tenggerimyces flavus]